MIAGGEQGSLGLVLTLEGLIMGIVGKKLLWRALAAANLAELNGYDFESYSVAPNNKLTESKLNGCGQRSSCSQMRLTRVDGRDADTRKKGQETEAQWSSSVVEPADSAEEAGLRYVSDDRPGYTRKANGKDFEYFDTEGKRIRDEQRLLRIKRLAVPPAWTRCLDLPVAKWPHSGKWPRRTSAEAVPLS